MEMEAGIFRNTTVGPVFLGWWAGDWVNRRSDGGLSELGLEEVWLVG